jgi:tRNA nucleotidyltransferase (CCA-adding enzyme)
VETLSAHRIRHELDLMLDEPRPAEDLARLAELDLLRPIHPALLYDRDVHTRLLRSEGPTPDTVPVWPAHELRWVLWLMMLPGDSIESLNKRLHFHAPLLKALLAASRLRDELPALIGAAPSRWVETLGQAPLLAAYAAGCASPSAQVRGGVEQYLAHWRHVKPTTTGRDLKALGINPGPRYAAILRELRRARLDGEVGSAEQEQAHLQDLLERQAAAKAARHATHK